MGDVSFVTYHNVNFFNVTLLRSRGSSVLSQAVRTTFTFIIFLMALFSGLILLDHPSEGSYDD